MRGTEKTQPTLGAPGSLTPEVKAAALEEFSPEEIVDMLLKVTGWTWNKVRVSLGLDAPMTEGVLTLFDYVDGTTVFV